MKKILLSMSAVSALALAAPAAAQSQYQGYGYQNRAYGEANFEARLERLETRLRAAVDRGTISRNAGWNLMQQLDQLEDLHDRYARDGLSQWEQQDLQQRLRELRRQIRLAGGNGWGRDDRWDDDDDFSSGGGQGQRDWVDRNNDGYDDRDYDRDGRWDDDVGNRVDRDRDGYDDRDYDRDGRWDDDLNSHVDRDNDGYDDRDWDRDGRWDEDLDDRVDRDRDGYDDRDYDRDGRWDDDVAEGRGGQAQQQRGIIGTLIDSFLGGGSNLRVGDRAPDNLGGVPYAYRNRFRDGNGVYFRSDGRAIYEIDVRSRTIVRVHPLPR